MLEHTGEVSLRLAVLRPRARDLDGQHVLRSRSQGVGDLEGVREEIALGVADVRAVEPDVGLVEDAVEHQPGPPARAEERVLEAAAVEQGPVVGRERR